VNVGAQTQETIKRATFRGVAWKIAAEVVTQVTRITVLLILARILTPADFGTVAIVFAFVMFVPVLADLGLGASLIQRPTLSETERATVFWTSLPLGTSFMLLGIAVSWPLAALFDKPSLQPLFAVFSISFLIASLSSVPNALLMRDMHFRSLELRVIASTLCGGAATIAFAFAGFGAAALVGGELIGRLVSLVALWSLCRWRPSLHFSWSALRELLAFGGSILGAHLLVQFAQSMQTLLVGRLLGPSALGRLSVAQTLVLLPSSRIAAPIQEVMFPAFSRMQSEPRRVLNAWNRVNQVTMSIALPALVGLVILAPEFTDVVLSARWAGTEQVIRALALSGAALALQRLTFSVLASLARTGSLIWIGWATLVSTAVAIGVGYHWGLTATAFALSIQAIGIQLATMWLGAHAVGATLGDVLRPLARIGVAASGMAIVVLVVATLLRSANAGDAATLVGCTLVGAAAYVVLIARLDSELVAELSSFVRHRGRGGSEETVGPSSARDEPQPAVGGGQ
jgi:O-antigen/teichoic acid export membrane protein